MRFSPVTRQRIINNLVRVTMAFLIVNFYACRQTQGDSELDISGDHFVSESDNAHKIHVWLKGAGGTCTGTLVSWTKIVTASHCSPAAKTVLWPSMPGEGAKVVEFNNDPNYNSANLGEKGDIAVITIEGIPVDLSDWIKDAIFPKISTNTSTNVDSFKDKSFRVYGYGGSEKLESAPMGIVEFREEGYSIELENNENILACAGDSGGGTILGSGTSSIELAAVSTAVKKTDTSQSKTCGILRAVNVAKHKEFLFNNGVPRNPPTDQKPIIDYITICLLYTSPSPRD